MIKINEGLRAGDLEGTIDKTFSVDKFKSKMGEDHDVMVLAFTATSAEAAKDLERFAEKGYSKILDADATPGTLEDGKYRVFVEFPRNEKIASDINEFVNDLKKLTNIETFQFTYHKRNVPFEASLENIKNVLPLTPIAYRQKINQLRLGECQHFFDKFESMTFKLEENIMTIQKHNDPNSLKFNLHMFGPTEAVMKECKAFLIDDKSMAECMYFTKYFGPYHITKTTEDRFIFTKDGDSAIVSKHKW